MKTLPPLTDEQRIKWCDSQKHCKECSDGKYTLWFDRYNYKCPRDLIVYEIKGLGDVVSKVTTAMGIKPCDGCKKRQELLNKIVPL